MHSRNPDIIDLARRIDRTPNAVALKMVNFASLDPTIERKGMSNVSALDRAVWDKFFNNIDSFLSNESASESTFNEISGLSDHNQAPFKLDPEMEGLDIESTTKLRRGQNYFRRMILSSYNYKCAVSGIMESQILVASHIAPWATHRERRLDPRNGICLNSLLDKSFDSGLISFSDDYEMLFSRNLSESSIQIISRMGRKLSLPEKFRPDLDLLREHRRRFNFL